MKRISSKSLALFFRQLSVLQSSGVLLNHALEFLEQGETDPRLRFLLDDLLGALLQGRYLSEAMRMHPEVFTRLQVEIIAVGEQTGGLTRCLDYLADLMWRDQERFQAVKSALIYPLFLFAAMLMVTVLFVVVVAPGDGGLFAALGEDVPWISKMLIEVSRFLTDPYLVVLSLTLAAGVGLGLRRFYLDNPGLVSMIHRGILKLPVAGPLIVRLQSAVILDILRACLQVGVSPVQALANCAKASGNETFRKGLQNALNDLKHGDGIAESLAAHTPMPRYVFALLEVGEASGKLVDLIAKATQLVDEEAQDTLDRLISLLEPALLMLGGVLAGIIAVATFLPIVKLLTTF